MGVHRQVRRCRDGWEIARLCARLSRPWRAAYWVALLSGERICRQHRFTPAEAFRLGLFLPGGEQAVIDRGYISRKRLTKLQKRLNPESCAPMVRDKAMFHCHCLRAGLPVPQLYAAVIGHSPIWRSGGRILARRADWVSFIRRDLPEQFVVKPTTGAYGRDVALYVRDGDRFLNSHGAPRRAEDIYDAMVANPRWDGFVIQQRLHNAPALIELSQTEALQTLRLITLVDLDGGCRVVHAHFKPIVGGHVADNILDGLTGNVEAPVRPADGVLSPATRIAGTGAGAETIDHHPTTGGPFAGFALPYWPAACDLAVTAAMAFLPLRTIGWDIALTPDGPVLVEGNVWWDPPNQHANIGPLVAALQAAAP